MIAEKLKIKVSGFVSNIIENDAQAFGFIKSDGSINRNAFLNKLIYTLNCLFDTEVLVEVD